MTDGAEGGGSMKKSASGTSLYCVAQAITRPTQYAIRVLRRTHSTQVTYPCFNQASTVQVFMMGRVPTGYRLPVPNYLLVCSIM